MIPIENQEIYQWIYYIFYIMIFSSGILFSAWTDKYLAGRKRLHDIRLLIETVDDALYDDNINEEEFRKIFEAAKQVIQK